MFQGTGVPPHGPHGYLRVRDPGPQPRGRVVELYTSGAYVGETRFVIDGKLVSSGGTYRWAFSADGSRLVWWETFADEARLVEGSSVLARSRHDSKLWILEDGRLVYGVSDAQTFEVRVGDAVAARVEHGGRACAIASLHLSRDGRRSAVELECAAWPLGSRYRWYLEGELVASEDFRGDGPGFSVPWPATVYR